MPIYRIAGNFRGTKYLWSDLQPRKPRIFYPTKITRYTVAAFFFYEKVAMPSTADIRSCWYTCEEKIREELEEQGKKEGGT